jgi:hypothetical protein
MKTRPKFSPAFPAISYQLTVLFASLLLTGVVPSRALAADATSAADAAVQRLAKTKMPDGTDFPALSSAQATACIPNETRCWVVAGIDDSDADDDSLGSLWVARFTEDVHGALSSLRTTRSRAPAPSVTPSQAYVSIDPLQFHISSDEVALGVHVGDELDTTSTGASQDTLVLYRFDAGRPVEIFRTIVDTSETDKTDTSGGGEREQHWILRFDTQMSNGMYDLIRHRVKPRSSASHDQRFVWNGTRYMSAHTQK